MLVPLLNNVVIHFSGNKNAYIQAKITELTILTFNASFTENQASWRPKVSQFLSFLRSPRPQKNRRGKPRRVLGRHSAHVSSGFLDPGSKHSYRHIRDHEYFSQQHNLPRGILPIW